MASPPPRNTICHRPSGIGDIEFIFPGKETVYISFLSSFLHLLSCVRDVFYIIFCPIARTYADF